MKPFRIDARFNGPPDSGNGGYVCGVLADQFDEDVRRSGVRARLHRPPPLETDLQIRATSEGVGLFEGDTILAEAWKGPLELDLPDPIDFEQAVQAAASFRGHTEHVFPACFVCGPERKAGDGMRIFPGTVADGPVFAAPWEPDASLCADGKHVDSAFLWAALDCPGCFSFPQPDNAILLLGELNAAIRRSVRAGTRCVLRSWQIEHKGRKHTTGSALYDERGDCVGYARGVWIEIPEVPLPSAGDAAPR